MNDSAKHFRLITLTLLSFFALPACSETGDMPELFAPDIVSTEAVELNSVLAPDGREFFFTRLIEGPDEQEGYPGKTRLIL